MKKNIKGTKAVGFYHLVAILSPEGLKTFFSPLELILLDVNLEAQGTKLLFSYQHGWCMTKVNEMTLSLYKTRQCVRSNENGEVKNFARWWGR